MTSLVVVVTIVVFVVGMPAVDARWPSILTKRSTSSSCSTRESATNARIYGAATLNAEDAPSDTLAIAPFHPSDMATSNEFVSSALLEQTYLVDDDSIVTLVGDDISCRHSHSPDALLHDKAVCPYYWGVNYDPDRLPMAIPEAYCRCSRATLPGKTGLTCQHITVDMNVLYVGGAEGTSCTRPRHATIAISVGCTAVMIDATRVFTAEGTHRRLTPVPARNEL